VLEHLRGRYGHHQIAEVEGELDEERLRVVQPEGGLQVRHQDVVEDGGESPHEKDDREHHERRRVALPRSRPVTLREAGAAVELRCHDRA
jgi:hypothetical protein